MIIHCKLIIIKYLHVKLLKLSKLTKTVNIKNGSNAIVLYLCNTIKH